MDKQVIIRYNKSVKPYKFYHLTADHIREN